jgi:arsenate reductase (thioredoxin)
MSKKLYPRIAATLYEVRESLPEPSGQRADVLMKVVNWLKADVSNRSLLFVCTHNSRRSHLAQYWAAAAAEFCDVPGIETYSAGTEATAMHPHTVEALIECGFEIIIPDVVASNPVYRVKLGGMLPESPGFSKTLTHESLPKDNFCAVLVCDSAAEACPFVPGASERIPVLYNDPKESDGTPKRRITYLNRSKEIAREMLWIMEMVAQK